MDMVAGEMASQKCAGMPMELFFGPEGSEGQPGESGSERVAREVRARRVCVSCPMRLVCLESELQWPIAEQWGVRGGLTAEERRELLKRQRRDGTYTPSRTSRITVGAWEALERDLPQMVDQIVGVA